MSKAIEAIVFLNMWAITLKTKYKEKLGECYINNNKLIANPKF